MADDIKVFSGGAPQSALLKLAPAFEMASGHKASFEFALVTEIQRKLAGGETADLVLLPAPLIAATEKTTPMRREGRGLLARVGIGVIVQAGAPHLDISTAKAVRELLLGARSIGFPDPGTPSGTYLRRMIDDLGIGDDVRSKIVGKPAFAGGGEMVAKGETEVGMYLLSEVQAVAGVDVIGLLPAPLQSHVTYGMAIPAHSARPKAALAFARFISDPARSKVWQAHGFDQVTGLLV